MTFSEPRGRPGCDHLGLNYYSRGVFDWKLSSSCNPGETMTDMPYALWADGLLVALDEVSRLGIPIYITETGVADAGDEVRPVMIESYMSKVGLACVVHRLPCSARSGARVRDVHLQRAFLFLISGGGGGEAGI